MGSPVYTVIGTDTVQDALLTKITSNFADLYTKVDPASAIGGYTNITNRLAAMQLEIDAAGTGDQKFFYGTDADRLAASPSNPSAWLVTDTFKLWSYVGTTWYEIADLNTDQTVAGIKTFSTVLVASQMTVSGAAAFTSTVSSTNPITAGSATDGDHVVIFDDLAILSQAF
jgi:hypothetical protein